MDDTCNASTSSCPEQGVLITANTFGGLLENLLKQLELMNLTKIGQNNVKPKKSKEHTKPKKSKQEKFPNYLPMNEVEGGLQSGRFKKGAIRISSKNSERAYITNEEYKQHDYVLESTFDRNRALEGDVVAIELKPEDECNEQTDRKIQADSNRAKTNSKGKTEPKVKRKKKYRSAVVVHILERVHSRITVGFLQEMPDNNKQFLKLIPRDYRLPVIRVMSSDCPDFYEDPKRYKRTLFKAKMTKWEDERYAVGSLTETLGEMGDLECETEALLVEKQLNISPFATDVLQDLPITDTIPDKELEYRKDLRRECIFTVDPITAHDLDDAVSCKRLENGNYEVGVHIADVTHYLKEDTPLDRVVCEKATTIYLVNKVYHMLPPELCKQCSFGPGVDKLAFSVIWEMTRTGRIVKQYFTRTIINSCVQLAYEHVQVMLDKPGYFFQYGELPAIYGGFTLEEIKEAVRDLQKIALNLRGCRFNNGAIRMDRHKLIFRLDPTNGEPAGFSMYEHQEANKFIEEFMLLANISVAQKIKETFPDQAFLRCHDPPNQLMLEKVKETLATYELNLEIETSKALQLSIWKIQKERKFGRTELVILYYLLSKSMRRAEYFCTTDAKHEDYHHYALSVPIYTHFTSPIRRYADVVVHRLLASSLGYNKKRQWKTKHLTSVASNCNKQKSNAKCAGQASSEMYLIRYITNKSQYIPFVQDAAVIGIGNNYLDLLVPTLGSIMRVYPKKEDKNIKCSHKQHVKPKKLVLTLPETPKLPKQQCEIYLFSVIEVELFQVPKRMKGSCT